MPLGDRTGPAGMGPMTGRAAGYCAGYAIPGYMNPIPGRGWFGRGRGGGWGKGRFRGDFRGWGAYYENPFYPNPPELSTEEELAFLKEEAATLKQQLEEVQSYINTLEKAKTEEKK